MEAIVVRAIILCMLLTACENAGKPPPDQAALVVVRFQEAPGGTTSRITGRGQTLPVGGIDSGLVLTRYLAETGTVARLKYQEATLHVSSGFYVINSFEGQLIRPGTYAITRFTQSERWGQCFNRSTFLIDIVAGDAVYLGTLDAKFHAATLTTAVIKANRTSLPNIETFIQYDVPDPPHLRPATRPAELTSAQAYARSAFPGITAELHQANLRNFSFEPVNHGLFGSMPACGGMPDIR